ncbi:MAG: outer membrane beta-barrel protein [Bacteroidota bacterium]|nr:outer membrane beta-barrel protein [Bacteroidota bacterium]
MKHANKYNNMKIYKKLFLFIVFGAILIPNINAQFTRQLSFGLKGGINFTFPNTGTEYSVFESSQIGPDQPDPFLKEYEPFTQNMASQFAFISSYAFSDKLSISFQPALFHYNFKYMSQYSWTGSQDYRLQFDFKQNLQYIELPLLLKFDLSDKKLQPYLQLGVHYSLLNKSTKYTTRTEENIYGEFIHDPLSAGTDSSYITSNIGAIGGLGLSYKFKRSKLGIETNFRYGFHNITRKDYRYRDNEITGQFYDAPDDMKLMNLSVNIVYTVSLRCLKSDPLPSYENL